MARHRIMRHGVKFEFDDRDFNAIRRSDEMASSLRSWAQDVAGRARASAPVDEGEYRDSIHVEVFQNTATRARARVVADVPHATLVESRTGNLRRAAGG